LLTGKIFRLAWRLFTLSDILRARIALYGVDALPYISEGFSMAFHHYDGKREKRLRNFIFKVAPTRAACCLVCSPHGNDKMI